MVRRRPNRPGPDGPDRLSHRASDRPSRRVFRRRPPAPTIRVSEEGCMGYRIDIDAGNCINCGICMDVCP
ncbi:MAG TPA: 4Fe-4S binding protein, partial [Candidatus Limnocylindrales bacterium]|nr:4Fe-4S binding protein [Candidatus Limnocylindrales bacterium]